MTVGQVVGDVALRPSRPAAPSSSRARGTTSSRRRSAAAVHAERAGLQPAHVEQVLDQAVEPVQRLLGGGQQFVAVLVGERRRRGCAGSSTAAFAGPAGCAGRG